MRHALTLLAAACLAPPAAADEVRMPGGGKLPTEVARTKDGPTTAWVAHAGKKFLAEPGKAAASDAPAAAFMDAYDLAAGDPDPKEPTTVRPLTASAGGKSYVMLVRANGDRVARHIGWVATDDPALIREPKCLDKAKVNRKAMVVNSIEMIVNNVPSAQYYRTPTGDQPVDSVNLFVVYFVYAEAAEYLLLGTDPQFKPLLNNPAQVVLGWMKKDRLCEWNTREGLSFEPRTLAARKFTLGDVFKDEDSAQAAKRDPTKILVTERPPRKSEVWKALPPEDFIKKYLAGVNSRDRDEQNEARDWAQDQDAQSRLMRWAVIESYRVGENVLHKIGVVGTVTSFDDAAEERERAALRRRVEELQNQVNKIDIVFVLCDGRSMTTWLQQMADLTQHIVENRAGIETLRVGVLLYNDTKNPEIRPALRLTELGANEEFKKSPLMKALRIAPCETNENTSPVHQAIIEGAKRLEDSQNKHTRRLIVLCGHNGSPEAEADPEAVAKALVGDGSRPPIEVLAVHMKGNANAAGPVAAFKAQLDKIKDLVERQTANLPVRAAFNYVEFSNENDAPRAKRFVTERYNSIRDTASELNEKFKKLRRGETKVVVEAQAGDAFTKELERRGFKPEDIKKLGERELFDIGYVWKEANGHTQVRYEILTKEGEIRDVIRSLGAMKAKVSPAASFKDLMRAGASVLVTAQTGDRRDDTKPLNDEEMDRILEKEYGLNFQSQLFKNSRATATKIEKAHYQTLEDIFKKNEMLKDVVAGNLFRYKESPVAIGGVAGIKQWDKVGNTAVRTVHRKFSLGGVKTQDWYWIHFDEEWP